MLARTSRPKLALALPTATATSHAMRSPALRSPLPPISPSPISPTARNTSLNQRGFSVIQPPTFAYAQSSETKSILKKGRKANLTAGKKIQFQDDPTIMCLSPVPEDYHGTYVKMTRDERRWGKRTWDREAGWRTWPISSGHLLTCILCGSNRSSAASVGGRGHLRYAVLFNNSDSLAGHWEVLSPLTGTWWVCITIEMYEMFVLGV